LEADKELIESNFEIQIFSDLGVMIYRIQVPFSKSIKLLLPGGVYYLKVMDGHHNPNLIETRKIVVLDYR